MTSIIIYYDMILNSMLLTFSLTFFKGNGISFPSHNHEIATKISACISQKWTAKCMYVLYECYYVMAKTHTRIRKLAVT